MSKFDLSLHAIEQIKNRGVPEEIVFEVLENPDRIDSEEEGQLIYQKLVLFDGQKQYLVRVFVNSDKIPNLVKTVYRTSKLSKYQ
ncbi:uncharacterized protein DUF4258 [Arcicella aurantiaca]|uniref:Uncharacterized protein DUF4258 n=1 Tax=Arcicella aurantiaca TaxID=591202 RepID=A0A316EI44_9BACT|nr:DUF4258 domain-containing protein [Arcicella aurantiaca]PWK29218.1 uncharacterized protein DUF4258 [Arcicella aurantiaca]